MRSDRTTTEVPLQASIPPPAVTIEGASFPDTLVGRTATRTVRVVAREPIMVRSLSTSDGAFSLGASPVQLPTLLAAGASLTVPVDFVPRARGAVGAELRVSTSAGDVAGVLAGRGVVAALQASAGSVPLRATVGGGSAHAVVSFTATGDVPLTIQSVTPPSAPFSARGLPAVGTPLAPGARLDVEVGYAPMRPGPGSGALTLATEVGPVVVRLLGTATAPPMARLLELRVVPATVRRGARHSPRLLLRLATRGTVTVVVLRARGRTGCKRRSGGCVRWRRVRSVRLELHAGLNRVPLDVAGLPRGSYRLAARVRGAAGPGGRRSASLRIV